jgi:hypothetical protein
VKVAWRLGEGDAHRGEMPLVFCLLYLSLPFLEIRNRSGSLSATGAFSFCLRHRHALIKVHILHGVQEFDAVLHGFLEGFAAADEAHATGALVDDGGHDGFG